MRTVGAIAVWVSVANASAQCPAWSPGFQAPGAYPTRSVLVWDDGGGPDLYVGGKFANAGWLPSGYLARWDGTQWSEVGGGIGASFSGEVATLAAYPPPASPALVVGGNLSSVGGLAVNGLAIFDGTSWSSTSLLASSTVDCAAVFDDGSGPQLYALGFLGLVPNTFEPLARWDGTSWTAIPLAPNAELETLRVLDLGTGPRLYLAGRQSSPSLGTVQSIAFHGTPPTAVGTGALPLAVQALEVFDDGSGPQLFAAGGPHATTGTYVTRLVGTTWLPVASVTPPAGSASVEALRSFDDGSGPALYAAGYFAPPGGVLGYQAMRFDGASWSGLGSLTQRGFDDAARCLEVFDPPGASPARLFVGGSMRVAGTSAANGLVSWRAPDWTPVGTGSGLIGSLQELESFTSAAGDHFVVALGNQRSVGTLASTGLSAWDGSTWRSLEDLGGLAQSADGLGTGSIGGQSQLFVGVRGPTQAESGVLAWDGNLWTRIAGNVNGAVLDLIEYDDGSGAQLVAGGPFGNLVAGSVGVARWNGASWSGMGTGIPGGAQRFAVLGTQLFASNVSGVWLWNGANWSLIGAPNGALSFPRVFAIAVHDDGSGPALYAAGGFDTLNGISVPRIARWTGTTWNAVGTPAFDLYINSLASCDLGNGARLYAAGSFTTVQAQVARSIADWDGVAWAPVDGGFSNGVYTAPVASLAVHDDGQGVVLFAGGIFNQAGSHVASSIARLACRSNNGAAFCAGDGLDPAVTSTCPCGNFGTLGNGCAHSFSAAGGRLEASGATVDDDAAAPGPHPMSLLATGLPASAFTLFLQHDAAGDSVFHDGVLCASGTLVRLRGRSAVGGAASFPNSAFAQDATTTLSQRGGVTPGSGVRRYYSAWYRNASTTFCPPATANVTNGWRTDW